MSTKYPFNLIDSDIIRLLKEYLNKISPYYIKSNPGETIDILTEKLFETIKPAIKVFFLSDHVPIYFTDDVCTIVSWNVDNAYENGYLETLYKTNYIKPEKPNNLFAPLLIKKPNNLNLIYLTDREIQLKIHEYPLKDFLSDLFAKILHLHICNMINDLKFNLNHPIILNFQEIGLELYNRLCPLIINDYPNQVVHDFHLQKLLRWKTTKIDPRNAPRNAPSNSIRKYFYEGNDEESCIEVGFCTIIIYPLNVPTQELTLIPCILSMSETGGNRILSCKSSYFMLNNNAYYNCHIKTDLVIPNLLKILDLNAEIFQINDVKIKKNRIGLQSTDTEFLHILNLLNIDRSITHELEAFSEDICDISKVPNIETLRKKVRVKIRKIKNYEYYNSIESLDFKIDSQICNAIKYIFGDFNKKRDDIISELQEISDDKRRQNEVLLFDACDLTSFNLYNYPYLLQRPEYQSALDHIIKIKPIDRDINLEPYKQPECLLPILNPESIKILITLHNSLNNEIIEELSFNTESKIDMNNLNLEYLCEKSMLYNYAIDYTISNEDKLFIILPFRVIKIKNCIEFKKSYCIIDGKHIIQENEYLTAIILFDMILKDGEIIDISKDTIPANNFTNKCYTINNLVNIPQNFENIRDEIDYSIDTNGLNRRYRFNIHTKLLTDIDNIILRNIAYYLKNDLKISTYYAITILFYKYPNIIFVVDNYIINGLCLCNNNSLSTIIGGQKLIDSYKEKYLKYKAKYLALKNLI